MARPTKSKPAAPPPSSGGEHNVRTVGFGPRDFEGTFKPGFNPVVGQNGTGKTRSVLLPLAWALGLDVPVVMRHGCEEAFVEIDGQRIRSLTKPMLNIGDVELALNAASPISDIILPDVQDPKRANVRRLEALLRLVDAPVTDETISILVENDQNILEYLAEVEPQLLQCSIVTVADRARRRTHEIKRRWEARADEAQGEINAHSNVEKPARVSKLSVEKAQSAYDTVVGDLREQEGEWRQRSEREAERKEIEGTLGERPDVEAASLHAEEMGSIALGRREQVTQLEDELSALKLRLVEAQGIAERANAAAKDADVKLGHTERLAELWDRRKAILDSEITGASEKDVETARAAVQQAREELSAARLTKDWQAACEAVQETQQERDMALKRAAHYEKLATGVTGRLALLLEKAGLTNLTVEDGELQHVHENGELEPFVDLSWGERTRTVIHLLRQKHMPFNTIVLPRMFYDGLDGEAREAVGGEFEKAGICVVLEEPGDEEGLRVEHV